MRNWKVGTITAGIILIAIGLLWFLQNFISIPYSKLLINAWPVACILLGIEILLFNIVRKEDTLRFHGFSIFLLILMMGVSLLFSIGHLFIKEIGYTFKSKNIEINDSKTITSSINEVIIKANNSEISVNGTDSSAVNVNGNIRVSDRNKKDSEKVSDYYSVKTLGDKMIIEIRNDDNQIFHFDHNRSQLNIDLPKSILTYINVKNGSVNLTNKENKTVINSNDGQINIENVTGNLVAKTRNGSISLTNANLNSDSEIATNDGEITIKNISGYLNSTTRDGSISIEHANIDGTSEITTYDGEINLSDYKGKINAKTNNGAINVEEALLNGNSKISSDDGEIQIDLLKDNNLTINAETNDGSFSGNIGWEMKNKDENHTNKAMVGNGENQLNVKTRNGSIYVNKD
ncbi:DUF4097 family beta strand repeat-containing protein [Gottfriedia acidiceleris]|uniref:DUF4097 family beta strand repeat-containing protein n=1 Tax=Bacillaceae TaxID=186817 RepID=UPI000BEDA58D|nr:MULTISPECIES: DUF4097 family beta strand repeat-containing protein [unclassified Bacillus (in: firmicutes)]PEC49987.1 hypothetical protein CON00_09035 [Bacillus sp. AFS096315]PFM79340.1 hypothetical protein COJ46_13685 [Bacillus sp. AFS077874]